MGTLALVTGLVLGSFLALLYVFFPIGKIGFPLGLLVCALELGIWFFCRRSTLPDKTTLTWAIAGTVSVSWLASLATHFAYQARIEKFTFAVLWVLCVPFYAVLGRAKNVLIATLMAASQPVVAVWSYSVGWAQGSPRDLFQSAAGSLLALAIAIAATELIRATRHEVARDVGGYTLVRKLGEGGMGEVWEGRHRLLARPAAIKLLGGNDVSRASMRRFEREAQATALLTSEHTVRLFDFGNTEDGRLYYVMELLEGLDLQRLLALRGALSPAHVVHLMDQVCDSVGEAHAAGMIHRDLKPSNLFLTSSGLNDEFVKVLDFGLVTVAGGMTLTHASPEFIGTAAYASPEALLDRKQDPRSDVYQLGCVMFFLLTNRPVFEAPTIVAFALAHVNDAPPRPSDVARQEIPADMERLVLRCLSKNPDERPRSGRELRSELRRLECFGAWSEQDAAGYGETVTEAQWRRSPIVGTLPGAGAPA